MEMPRKKILIYGGAGLVALLALFLYMRARGAGSGAPADDDGGADIMGGSTLLFTPPSPLSAPGANDWGSSAGSVTGGSTSLTDALLQQDRSATQLGQASLLTSLADAVIGSVQPGQLGWKYSALFEPTPDGGISFDSQFMAGRDFISGRITESDIAKYEQLAKLPGMSSADLERLQEQMFFSRTGNPTAPQWIGPGAGSTLDLPPANVFAYEQGSSVPGTAAQSKAAKAGKERRADRGKP